MRTSPLFLYGLTLLLLLACQNGSDAQDTASQPEINSEVQQDPLALVQAAEAKFASLSSYKCHLRVHSTHPNTGDPIMSEGYFYGQKGAYHLDFAEDVTICDGKQILIWYKEFAEVDLKAYDPKTDLSLQGMYGLYAADHSLTYKEEVEGRHHIFLIPTNEKDNFYQKEIWIGKESGLIEKYALQSRHLGTFEYEFVDVDVNGELDPELFVIDEGFVERVRAGEVPPEEHGHEGHEH